LEISRLDTLLFGWQKKYWALPVWPEKTIHTGTINAGVSTLTFDTSYADYRDATLAIIWQSSSIFDVVLIDTVYPTYLSLSTVTNRSFTGTKLIMPCRLAKMITPTSGNQESRKEGIWNFSFMVVDNVLLTEHIPLVEYPEGTSADSQEVVTIPSLIKDGEETESDADLSSQDYGIGGFDFFSDSTYNILSRPYKKRNRTKAECWAFRLWLHSFYGRQNVKWFPTFKNDLTLIDPIGPADESFEIENIGLASNMGLNSLRTHLVFVLSDGTQLYREIININENSSGTETVTIDSVLGQTIGVDDIVCFLDKCRLASDETEIMWKTGDENEYDLTIMGVTA